MSSDMSDPKRPRMEEDVAVATFRRYLRINTSQPNPDYGNTRLEVPISLHVN